MKAEVQELLALAERADRADVPDGVSLPEETRRREDRLVAMAAAQAKIAARAKERYAREKAEYDEKMARRVDREKDSGKKPGGKPPKAPSPVMNIIRTGGRGIASLPPCRTMPC